MTNEVRFSREEAGATPPPADFDPLTADPKSLARYGLPRRPDRQSQPGLSALWDRQARRYRTFEHLQAEVPRPPQTGSDMAPEALLLYPVGTCGYTLDSFGDPFTTLAVTWTVPNLRHTPNAQGLNKFRTFVGLGFLDVHVEMTVDSTNNVTATITALNVDTVGLPVQPGDVISAGICLSTSPPGRATYVLANETRSQTVNFSFNSGFPPAVTVNAGISRSTVDHPSSNPLAHFGVVYFDEISAYTTAGSRSLTGGEAVTMVDLDGSTLAKPVRLNDYAFKIVRVA